MSDSLLPSLSESSWITSSNQIADLLFAHFFESDYSQDSIYEGKVSSLAYIVAVNYKDPDKLCSDLQITLQSYYGRYFNNVNCEVTYQRSANDSSIILTTLYMDFTDKEGIVYNLSKVITTSGNKIVSVLNSNNYGI